MSLDHSRNPTRVRVAVLADSPLLQLKSGTGGRDSGQSTWLSQIADNFAERTEFAFYWVSFDRSLTQPHREIYKGISYLFYPKIPWQLDELMALLPSRLLLGQAITSIRPDVIHAWGSERTYASVIRSKNIPSIFSLQGLLKRYREVGGLPQSATFRTTHPSWHLAEARERRYVNSADIVTAESAWAISLLRKYYSPHDTRMVEYGVHPSFYSVPWRPEEDKPYFVFVGSLSEIKGIPALLEAVRKCRTSGWRLYLVGEGPLKNWAKEQKLEQIECLGVLGWAALQSRLSKAWALIHPTKADSSPNSVKEARVIGLPVITTKEGGQSGYVHHGENGIIVPASDPASLASAIDLLAGNFEMVKRMGQIHHAKDRDYFRPEKTASAFCNLYLELARRAAKRL